MLPILEAFPVRPIPCEETRKGVKRRDVGQKASTLRVSEAQQAGQSTVASSRHFDSSGVDVAHTLAVVIFGRDIRHAEVSGRRRPE